MIFDSLLDPDTLWLVFLISGTLTILFATKTVKYFTLYGMQSTASISALGGILLALITSLPELVNGIVSGISGNSSLVYSNVTGANSILLVFYAVFSIYFTNKAMKQKPTKNVATVVFAVLVAMLMFGIVFFMKEPITINIGNQKMSVLIIIQFIFYVLFVFYLLKGKSSLVETPIEQTKTRIKKRHHILLVFAFFSFLLIISAILLNNVVSRMGEPVDLGGYGLGSTLTGALFLSVVTTLPEIVSMFKLMKSGLLNVAITSAIGSHMFNFTILFVTDAINSNSVLEQVYVTNYTQQSYIWGIYFFSYIIFLNGIYNKFIKVKKEYLVLNFIQIPIIFVSGWLLFGLRS